VEDLEGKTAVGRRLAEPVTHWAEVLCVSAEDGAVARWVCVIPHTATGVPGAPQRWSFTSGGASVDCPNDVASSRRSQQPMPYVIGFRSRSSDPHYDIVPIGSKGGGGGSGSGGGGVGGVGVKDSRSNDGFSLDARRQISTTQPSRSQLSITQPISSGGEGGGRDVHTSSARGGAKDLTRKYAAIFSQVLSGFRV
jgi:hypothetical protein